MFVVRTFKQTVAILPIVFGLALLFSVGCSSTQQQQTDEEDLDVTEEGNVPANNANLANNAVLNQQSDFGNDDAAEGNGQENYVDGDPVGNEAVNGADTNSVYEDTGDADALLTNNTMSANNTGAMNAGMNAAGNAPMNATMNAGMNTGGGNAAAMPSNAAVPTAPSSDTAPVPGGRVRYVPAGGVQVVNSPGGSVVAKLDQGEHPITWEESGYLRLGSGLYVPVGSMSDKGVARPFPTRSWQGGR